MRWPEPSPRIDRPDVKRRIQNRAGISTAPARARCSAALRKSRRPAATPGVRSPAPAPQVSHRARLRLMQKSARATRGLAADFLHSFPRGKLKTGFNSRHGFSNSISKIQRGFFNPGLGVAALFLFAFAHKKNRSRQRQPGPVARRVSQFLFPNSRRVSFQKSAAVFSNSVSKSRNGFFQVAHQVSHKSPAKSRFRGNWGNQNIAHSTPNPRRACHAVSRS